jgi:hypothetical protein
VPFLPLGGREKGGVKGSRIEIQQKGINISSYRSIVLISLGPAGGALINAIELLSMGVFGAKGGYSDYFSGCTYTNTAQVGSFVFQCLYQSAFSSLLDMTINAYGHYSVRRTVDIT